jgi:hypothetical protein
MDKTDDVKKGLTGPFARGFFTASCMLEVAQYVYLEAENFQFSDAVQHCLALRVIFLHS